jgi:2-C-methyl-D-erythritol 4-phosphate cytidylyltransferase
MKKSVIIVAGGSGKRMGADVPKQFLLLRYKPVLMHTIERFFTYNNQINIVLVLPKEQIDTWKNLCAAYHFSVPHQIAEGGAERFNSVKNGLDKILQSGIVAVHDGVRPLVSIDTINRCFNKAEETGAAIPVIPVVDSLRKVDGETSIAVNRADYVCVQTPQCFNIDILKKAYQQGFTMAFTDDASVVEKSGNNVSLVEGNIENIKITTPQDLILAEQLLSQ